MVHKTHYRLAIRSFFRHCHIYQTFSYHTLHLKLVHSKLVIFPRTKLLLAFMLCTSLHKLSETIAGTMSLVISKPFRRLNDIFTHTSSRLPLTLGYSQANVTYPL